MRASEVACGLAPFMLGFVGEEAGPSTARRCVDQRTCGRLVFMSAFVRTSHMECGV